MKNSCKKLALVASMVGAMWATAPAQAAMGDSIFAAGGDITLTFWGYEAGYTDVLGLASPTSVTPIFTNKTAPIGSTFDLGSFAAGTELVFSLFVQNTGFTYFTGDASANVDNVAHANVEFDGNGGAVVSFEDLFGGGDKDYNDLIFSLSGVGEGGTPVVPEPSEWLMFSAGLLAVGVLARRRRASQD